MRSCPQTDTQSTYDHGISVNSYFNDLLNHLKNDTPLTYKWILPEWIYSYKDIIISSLPDKETLDLYTIFHDCGKFNCLVIDENGKRHFPNHSEESYKIFKQVFDNEIAAQLIKRDMDIHLLKSEDILDFCKYEYALTLLIVGLSEIHSNSEMFGGLESISFIIKKNKLFKKGKHIVNILKNRK
jgi:hypothetical protein